MTTWTAEAYLAFERAREDRHEFINGQVVPRAISDLTHNEIMVNLVGAIHPGLRGNRCYILMLMRVRVLTTGDYLYPDLVGFCGDSDLEDAHEDTLLNPALMIEILSPETEAFDRGRKFELYRQMPSVQEYLLVSSDSPLIEHYARRDDTTWVYTAHSGLDAQPIALASIGCTLQLAEVYQEVNFDDPGSA
jgi:Uma2 family endonuclease